MASDVMTLFNMPSSQEIGQAYLNSQMVSPAQMGQQGLLQQGISMAGNQGAMMGYGAGRLLGGMAPQEARARGIEEAMAKVQSMGLTSDAEMYSALSRELAARGLTQDAFAANKEARTAMRDEQLIKKGGFDIQKAELDVQKAKEDMLTLEEQIAIAMSQGEESKAAGLQRQLEAKKKAIELVDAQIYHQKKSADAAVTNAAASAERAKAAADQEKFTIPVYAPGIVPGTRGDIIGRQNKQGQVMGNDGLVYNSVNELLASRTPAAQQTPPKPEDKKQPTGNIRDFLGAPVTPQATPWAAM